MKLNDRVYFSNARRHIARHQYDEALKELDLVPSANRHRDGSLRELRLCCLTAMHRWEEGEDLADELLHDGLKLNAVARYHCAFARHRLESGDFSRAIWEIALALQTDESTIETVLEDDTLRTVFSG